MAVSTDTPDYVRDEVKTAAPNLTLIRDLMGGTDAMHRSASLANYIPQWPDETDATWMKRSHAGTLYEGFGRTLSASVGMIFAKPPQVDFSQAPTLEEHAWDIDGAGTAFEVFAKRVAEHAIADGHALIVVDFPPRPEGRVSAADEAAMNLRSRWALYPRSSILSWRTAVVRNRLQIVQIVLFEPTTISVGAFGVREVKRYRVLSLVDGVAQWALWEKPQDNSGVEWSVPESGVFTNRRGETRDTLPIAVAVAGRQHAPLVTDPPLKGVAYANLQHFRNKTELEWGSRITAIEQLVVNGNLVQQMGTDGQLAPPQVKMGWEHMLNVEAGGGASYIGPSGAGLGQLKLRMQEAEQEMAAQGMSFLSRDTRAAETAEAKRLDATAENSTLATAGHGLEDAYDIGWAHHAWFEGIDEALAPTVTINRDFDQLGIDAARAGLIAPLIQTGLPIRKALEILRDGGFLKIADEDEFEDIVMEWETGKVASEDAARLEAERRMQPPLEQAA